MIVGGDNARSIHVHAHTHTLSYLPLQGGDVAALVLQGALQGLQLLLQPVCIQTVGVLVLCGGEGVGVRVCPAAACVYQGGCVFVHVMYVCLIMQRKAPIGPTHPPPHTTTTTNQTRHPPPHLPFLLLLPSPLPHPPLRCCLCLPLLGLSEKSVV